MGLETFKQLKDGLADWIGTSTTSTRWNDTTRGLLINRAVRYIARKYDLRYNEDVAYYVLVPGQLAYVLPGTYSRPFFAWYQHPVTQQVVKVYFLPKDQFDALYPNPTSRSMPGHFTVYGPNLQFGKTPDQAATVNFLFYSIPLDLIADADFNNFTRGCWEAVFDRALVEATEYMIEDDRIDVWKAKWKDTEAALVMEQTRSRSTGLLAQSIEPH